MKDFAKNVSWKFASPLMVLSGGHQRNCRTDFATSDTSLLLANWRMTRLRFFDAVMGLLNSYRLRAYQETQKQLAALWQHGLDFMVAGIMCKQNAILGSLFSFVLLCARGLLLIFEMSIYYVISHSVCALKVFFITICFADLKEFSNAF